MKKSGLFLGLLAIVAIVVAVVSFQPAEKKEKVVVADKTKVGFVYVGPVADAGWTYEHDRGRLAVSCTATRWTFVESVSEDQTRSG